MELHTNKAVGGRYWVARVLFLLGAWIINSELITKRTLPTLEAE
jgi:hypothetical protein